MSFVKPKYSKLEASGRFLGNQTQLRTSIPLIAEKMQERLREPFPAYTSFTSVSFVQDVPSSVKRRIKDEFDVVFSDKMCIRDRPIPAQKHVSHPTWQAFHLLFQ